MCIHLQLQILMHVEKKKTYETVDRKKNNSIMLNKNIKKNILI
jgi:hypothetical protein